MPARPLALCLLAICISLAACQAAPATPVVVVVTQIVEVVVTATPPGFQAPPPSSTGTATPPASAQPSDRAPLTITPTATRDPFPTPVHGTIYVAEQRFENGWMFWLQSNGQIWVLSINDSGERLWTVHSDDFAEGEPEDDPNIIPPEGYLQPIRGFGKLWRENLDVQSAVGWAVENELGHTTRYEYHAGGKVNENNEYERAGGHHLIRSFYGDAFRFDESDSTWQIDE